MSPESLRSLLLAGVSLGFGVPVVASLALGGCAAVVLGRELRTERQLAVIGLALAGVIGVGTQLVIANSAPASQLAVIVGTVGGWCWYVCWLQSGQKQRLAEQGLAVGGLLWIAGTVTLAVSFGGPEWPLLASLGLGVAAAVVTAVLSRASPIRASRPVVVAFVSPGVVGFLLGPELLFMLFVICAVSALIGWSLVRLEQGR